MADRRYIAQDITDSGQVEQLVRALGGRDGFWAATFFSWLIPFFDDDGRLIGQPHALRSKVLSRYQDLVGDDEVAEALALMNDVDLVQWYEVKGSPGERYLYSPRFTRHQTLRADRYGPSRHPAPPGWQPDTDHPYGKNPDLQRQKPQRDRRATVRVPRRRAVNKGEETQSATTSQPARDHIAPRMFPPGDEASRHPTSPLLASPLASSRLAAAGAASPARDAAGSRHAGAAPDYRVLEGAEREERLGACLEVLAQVEDPGWRRVLEEIAVRLNSVANFTTWFGKAQLRVLTDGVYDVVLPNEFTRSWVRDKYDALVRMSLARAFGTAPVERDAIAYVLEGETREREAEADDAEPEIPEGPARVSERSA